IVNQCHIIGVKMVDGRSYRSENRADKEEHSVPTLEGVRESSASSDQEQAGNASDHESRVRYDIQCVWNCCDDLSLIREIVILLRLRYRRCKQEQGKQGCTAEAEEPLDVPHADIVSRNPSLVYWNAPRASNRDPTFARSCQRGACWSGGLAAAW